MRRGSFRIPEVTPILLGFIVATSDTDYALLRNAVRPDFRNAEFSLFVLIQPAQRLGHVAEVEGLAYIACHKPRFAVKGINLLMPIR